MCLLRVMACDLHFDLHRRVKIVLKTNNIVSGTNLVIYQLLYGMYTFATDTSSYYQIRHSCSLMSMG